MSDVTAGAGGGMTMPTRGQMGSLLNRPDLFLAIGVMGILVVLIFPLPAVLLDLLLALSIILSQSGHLQDPTSGTIQASLCCNDLGHMIIRLFAVMTWKT